MLAIFPRSPDRSPLLTVTTTDAFRRTAGNNDVARRKIDATVLTQFQNSIKLLSCLGGSAIIFLFRHVSGSCWSTNRLDKTQTAYSSPERRRAVSSCDPGRSPGKDLKNNTRERSGLGRVHRLFSTLEHPRTLQATVEGDIKISVA